MRRNPAFELLEFICQELVGREETVILEDEVPPHLQTELENHYETTASRVAFESALASLSQHFQQKGSLLPFEYVLPTSTFRVVDREYTEFIASSSNKRGPVLADAQDFEIRTVGRLGKRLTGELHRVGFPRSRRKSRASLANYLQSLGYRENCLEPNDKDGGFDILWFPPLGSFPLRAVVSLQCKNSFFDRRDADASVGQATRTQNRHSHVNANNMLNLVIFNDYIDEQYNGYASGWAFIPLGLSDLGDIPRPMDTHIL
jgi:hypothetical protein